jgi:hypothetical protein
MRTRLGPPSTFKHCGIGQRGWPDIGLYVCDPIRQLATAFGDTHMRVYVRASRRLSDCFRTHNHFDGRLHVEVAPSVDRNAAFFANLDATSNCVCSLSAFVPTTAGKCAPQR